MLSQCKRVTSCSRATLIILITAQKDKKSDFYFPRVLRPRILWAQRNDTLLLTVNLTDIKNEKFSLDEKKLTFEGMGGPDERQYACELEFMKEVVPQVK